MQICNGTKTNGIRCRCKAKNGQYCGYHNKNNVICSFCNVNEISKFNVKQCWECIKNKKQKILEIKLKNTKKLECSDDLILDILALIWNFCDSDTKLKLRILCNYTYDKLAPTELYTHCSKIVFNRKSSMDALKVLHIQHNNKLNFVKYLDYLPNFRELYMPWHIPTQKFLNKLSENMEVLILDIFSSDINIIDISRFTNLRKLGNITDVPRNFVSSLSKLKEVTSNIELDLPKSITSFNELRWHRNNYKLENVDFLKGYNIVKLKHITTDLDLNFLSDSLEYFDGCLKYISQISECKKLKHINVGCKIPKDTIVDFPKLECLKIKNGSRFVNSTKLKKLICKNDDLSFIESFINLKYLKCNRLYNINNEVNLKYLELLTVDNKSLENLKLINADYFKLNKFKNENVEKIRDKFPYTKEEFPIFENIKTLEMYNTCKKYFLSIPLENFPNLEVLYINKIFKYMKTKCDKLKIKLREYDSYTFSQFKITII
uniref:Uncharacterized protein n=1 Tax=Pithovirus LCDPAC02 TaxID=2506601 RepID=A0A481YQT0_9VIRU|nr:MAG: hypothetical protein LCDPAC02_00130 [Pithovirus LCDPAC02]